jgi:uncharacterized protein
VIVYLDSSVVVRAYLADEEGHVEAGAMLSDPDVAAITGTWTRIEVSGALARASRRGRCDGSTLLALLDDDLGADGPITVVSPPQSEIERVALGIVRSHAIRAMDAWHIAVATLTLPDLLEPGEVAHFATSDAEQAKAAEAMALVPV